MLAELDELVLHEESTAPTTPEGSLTFSPVLRPLAGADAFDNDAGLSSMGHLAGTSLWTHLRNTLENGRPAVPVRSICCVGAGYVGGPTAAVIALNNPHIRVTVVDRDTNRIRRWMSKHPPIYEPGLAKVVRIARDGTNDCTFVNERSSSDYSAPCISDESAVWNDRFVTVPERQPNLFFSTDVAGCIGKADVVLIAVNTPTKSRGLGAGSATDMTAFEAVTAVVAQHAKPGAVIVEKSTVPSRTAEMVRETMAIHRPGVHFEILSNPEFLAAGTAINDLLHPDRVLIGSPATPSGRRAAEALASVYAAWVPRSRIVTTNVWSAELAKLVANSMLAQRISSINSIAAICEETGADVDEVAAAVGRDLRIGGKFLKAGIGFGGSCFKKDVLSLVYLAKSLGLDEQAEYWRMVVGMNEAARERFVRRVVRCLNGTLVGKKIVVLGYAFKKDTDDTREAPALEMVRGLLREGPREVAIYDPCCDAGLVRGEIGRLVEGDGEGNGVVVSVYEDVYRACEGADAVLIATDFDEFRLGKETVVEKGMGHRSLAATGAVVKDDAHPVKELPTDPRPFAGMAPSESEILALETYLAAASSPTRSGTTSLDGADTLGRYREEPACEPDCTDCRAEVARGMKDLSSTRRKEPLDWERVARGLRAPRWVFDGRNVVDPGAAAALGLRLESVGKRRVGV